MPQQPSGTNNYVRLTVYYPRVDKLPRRTRVSLFHFFDDRNAEAVAEARTWIRLTRAGFDEVAHVAAWNAEPLSSPYVSQIGRSDKELS